MGGGGGRVDFQFARGGPVFQKLLFFISLLRLVYDEHVRKKLARDFGILVLSLFSLYNISSAKAAMLLVIRPSSEHKIQTKLLLANPYANIEGQRIVVIPQQCKQRRTLYTFNQMTRNK